MKKRVYLLSGLLCFCLIFILSSLATPKSYEKDLRAFEIIDEQYKEIVCRNASSMTLSPKKTSEYDYLWASYAYWRCQNDGEIENEDIQRLFDILNRKKTGKEDDIVSDIRNQLDEHISKYE